MSKKHPSSALERFQTLRPHLEDNVSLVYLAKSSGFSLSTLKKWLHRYRQSGINGLDRKSRSDKGSRRLISPELEQLVEALALKKPPISIAAIHRKVSEVAKTKGHQIPTYKVIWLTVKEIDPALIMLAHEGTKDYNQKYGLLYRREASYPNEIWQADHTPLDIVLLDEKGSSRKPWLTTIIDDYSRVICGYFLSFEAPCSVNTALALRQAIWRKQNPNWQVCGIPQILYSDNGSDFKSNHIKQVAADLKIQLKNSIPGKPQGRGRIERLFLTINQLLLMSLPGYAPPKTKYPVAKLTLTDFIPLFEQFIIHEYHQRKHSGINMSPLKRWNENGFLPHLPESSERLDLLLLTVVRPRKVHRDGIHFQTFSYIAPTLAAYVNETVTIRYDPRDLGEIRVYYQNQYLCRAICQALAGKSFSLKDIIQARQKRKKELRKTIAERKSLMDTLLDSPKKKFLPPTNPPKPKQKEAQKKRLKLYEND